MKITITRILHEEIRDLDFFTGIRCDILPCCIDFYELSWLPSIKKEIPEYSKTMYELCNRRGVILCPDCVSKKITDLVLHSVSV